MPFVTLTSQNLRDLALRGEESVRPGRKLLLIHIDDWYSSFEEVTSVTGLIYLSNRELDGLLGRKDYGTTERMYNVFLYRKSDGTIRYRHAADAGILPYNMGKDNAQWNNVNFTVDKKMMKKLGIKIQN